MISSTTPSALLRAVCAPVCTPAMRALRTSGEAVFTFTLAVWLPVCVPVWAPGLRACWAPGLCACLGSRSELLSASAQPQRASDNGYYRDQGLQRPLALHPETIWPAFPHHPGPSPGGVPQASAWAYWEAHTVWADSDSTIFLRHQSHAGYRRYQANRSKHPQPRDQSENSQKTSEKY